MTGQGARATPPGPAMAGSLYALAAVSGNALVHGGGTSSPTGNVSGPVYAYGSFGSNNVPHAPDLPATQTNYDGTACPGAPVNHVDNGGGGNSLDYAWQNGSGNQQRAPAQLRSFSPTTSGLPTYTSTAAAKDASGNWKPGIYNGIYPSGGKLDGGVYQLVNVTSTISLGTITNTTYTSAGTADAAGAVAFVLDSSDTGSIDMTNAVLNGLDDLNGRSFQGQRDPMGTHNFIFFSTSGAGGYTGGITIGPHASTNISGILYLPKSTITFDGNSSPQFTGSVMAGSETINGGGNGTQQFNWVCGLNAVAGAATQGGLVR